MESPSSAEFQFLLTCLRSSLHPGHDQPPSSDHLDDTRFLSLLDRHRLLPQVGDVLCRAQGDRFSNSLVAKARREWTARALRWAAGLVQVNGVLSAVDASPIAFKGPALAAHLYGRFDRRQYRDLDFLIRPELLADAVAGLAEIGYRPLTAVDPRVMSAGQARRYLRADHTLSLIREEPAGGALVELHWRLTDDPNYFPLPTRELRESACAVEIGDTKVQTLSGAPLLLYLAFHGGKHRWMRLSWLCDFCQAWLHDGGWRSEAWSRASGTVMENYLQLAQNFASHLDLIRLPIDQSERKSPLQEEFLATASAEEALPLEGLSEVCGFRARFANKRSLAIRRFLKAACPKPADIVKGGVATAWWSRWSHLVAKGLRLG